MDGRFISKDPVSFDGGDVNLYGMVRNNSISYTDPNGLSPQDRVDWALEQFRYFRDFWKGSYFGKKNKCNEFVAAAHNQGDPAAVDYPTVLRNDGYTKPTVADLANPNFARSQLDYLPIMDAQPGDIIVWYGNDTHHTALYLGGGLVMYQNWQQGLKLNTVQGYSQARHFTGDPIVRRYRY
jgi:uncharacterized protein RhaS with RHS repeats